MARVEVVHCCLAGSPQGALLAAHDAELSLSACGSVRSAGAANSAGYGTSGNTSPAVCPELLPRVGGKRRAEAPLPASLLTPFVRVRHIPALPCPVSWQKQLLLLARQPAWLRRPCPAVSSSPSPPPHSPTPAPATNHPPLPSASALLPCAGPPDEQHRPAHPLLLRRAPLSTPSHPDSTLTTQPNVSERLPGQLPVTTQQSTPAMPALLRRHCAASQPSSHSAPLSCLALPLLFLLCSWMTPYPRFVFLRPTHSAPCLRLPPPWLRNAARCRAPAASAGAAWQCACRPSLQRRRRAPCVHAPAQPSPSPPFIANHCLPYRSAPHPFNARRRRRHSGPAARATPLLFPFPTVFPKQ